MFDPCNRPQRPGESHGLDYFFVTRKQFEDWIKAGQLLEYAIVYGDYKGIPRAQVVEPCTIHFLLCCQGMMSSRKIQTKVAFQCRWRRLWRDALMLCCVLMSREPAL